MCPSVARSLCMLAAVLLHLSSSSPAGASPSSAPQRASQAQPDPQALQRLGQTEPALPPAECRAIPANIDVQDKLERTVLRLIERSRTFRLQCAAIGAVPSVHVSLRLASGLGALVRARTELATYPDGRTRATINVPVSRDLPELMAHEFEHVIEHLDGIRLRTAAPASRGLIDVGGNAYESKRAIVAGRAAAMEVDRFKAPLSHGASPVIRRP